MADPKTAPQRNLSDSIKPAPRCKTCWAPTRNAPTPRKNATSLQDLARQAFGERRWPEAAALYRKAEDQWDVATERCTGTAQDTAQRRREQAEIDGYNAEFCAPLYDKAREVTQRTRSLAPGMSREEKQDALQLSETLWRDALGVCKGTVQDTARSNVQAWHASAAPLGRYPASPGLGNLGPLTNWVNPSQLANLRPTPQEPPPPTPAPTPTTPPPPPAPRRPARGPQRSRRQHRPERRQRRCGHGQRCRGGAAQAAASALPGKVMPSEFTAGTARFTGQFSLDAGGKTYTGQGRILWANGDIYEGALVRGQNTARAASPGPTASATTATGSKTNPTAKPASTLPTATSTTAR